MSHFKVPEPQKNLEEAWRLAWLKLQSRDLSRIAGNSGAELDGNVLRLKMLDEVYEIDTSSKSVRLAGGGDAPLRQAVLILHYLEQANGAPLSGVEAGFPELSGGAFYEGPFRGRIILRLAREFGDAPEDFLKCAIDLGGSKGKYGDACSTFHLFPNVPVTMIIWRGDEELPPAANVIFDRGIENYLPTEDIVIGCETIVGRLCKMHRSMSRK